MKDKIHVWLPICILAASGWWLYRHAPAPVAPVPVRETLAGGRRLLDLEIKAGSATNPDIDIEKVKGVFQGLAFSDSIAPHSRDVVPVRATEGDWTSFVLSKPNSRSEGEMYQDVVLAKWKGGHIIARICFAGQFRESVRDEEFNREMEAAYSDLAKAAGEIGLEVVKMPRAVVVD